MDKLLAMTDLHLTVAGDAIIGLDPLTRLRAVLAHASRNHADAKALILMGDLAHHGLTDEYARLATALADLPWPVIPMLGNHDRREAFLQVFPDAPLQDGFVQSIHDLPHHRIITLDTLDGPPYPPGHHSGRLCDRRMAFLQAALAGAGNRIPLVFTHHPPFKTGIAGMDMIRLTDGAALLDLLATSPGAYLLCGHIHRTISGSTHGVPWTMFKSPCHQGVLDLSTPDSSLSIDEPGAYGVILLPENGVVAHSQDVGASGPVVRDGHSVSGGAKNPADG